MAKKFSIMVSANGTKASYTFETILSRGFGWVGGDRVGYGCAYAFLADAHRVAAARVTFTRIEYAKINDKRMDEGARHYDGTVYVGPRRQLGECPPPAEEYVPHFGPFPPAPQIIFSIPTTAGRSGEVIDVRDYAIDPQSGIDPFRYDFVGVQSEAHVGFVAYQHQDDSGQDEPVFAIYYDVLTAAIAMSH